MAVSFSRSVREKAKLVKVIFHFDASHQQVKFYGKNSIEFFFSYENCVLVTITIYITWAEVIIKLADQLANSGVEWIIFLSNWRERPICLQVQRLSSNTFLAPVNLQCISISTRVEVK